MTVVDIIQWTFFILTGLILIKTILLFIIGDTDIDIDFDSDMDGSISNVFSLKGILHFLWGACGGAFYLTVLGFDYTEWNYMTVLIQIMFSLFTGILSFLLLAYVYNSMLKLNSEPDDVILENEDQFDARVSLIYERPEREIYIAFCETHVSNFGSMTVPAELFNDDADKVNPGDIVRLVKFPNHEEYITLESGETVKFYINPINS